MHNVVSNLWAVVILLLGPIVGLASRRKFQGAAPRRRVLYLSNAANLLVLGGITATIDFTHGRKALGLMTSGVSARAILTWSVCFGVVCVMVAVMVLVIRAWLRRPPNESITALLPRSTGEKIAFLILCLLIALVEEFIYRGFVLTLLREWLASGIFAIGLVSLSFALMHGLQDLIAIISAFVQGILLGLPVLILHSLVPSIAAHFAVDVFAGFCMLTLLSRLGALTETEDLGAVIAKT